MDTERAVAMLSAAGISAREQECALLVADGLTNREIADRLFLEEKTVKNYLTRVYQALDIGSTRKRVRLTLLMERSS